MSDVRDTLNELYSKAVRANARLDGDTSWVAELEPTGYVFVVEAVKDLRSVYATVSDISYDDLRDIQTAFTRLGISLSERHPTYDLIGALLDARP